MTPLIAAVFLASLLGSLHCAGMCGAFLAFAVGADGRPAPRIPLHGAYHAGRLVTYTTFGTIAGWAGSAIDLGGSMINLHRTTAALSGAIMVVFGMAAVLRVLGFRAMRAPAPAFMQRALVAGHRAAFTLAPIPRAGAIGLLTTLLPCGWLYAFVLTAAGTASPAMGALTMLVFWAGTLPVMMTLGVGLQSLTGGLRRRLPLITSLTVVAVGLFTVVSRLTGHDHALPSSAMLLPAGDHADAMPECMP